MFYIDLPGDAKIVGTRFRYYERNFFDVYRIGDGQVDFARNSHDALSYAASLAAGESWSDHSGSSEDAWGNISSLDPSTGEAFLPRDYPTYIPFRFLDTTDSDAAKFGYMKISTVLSGSGDDTVLTWNIYEYAYESNAHEEIFMGVVPEPSTVLTLVLGTLVLIGYRRVRL